MNRRSLFAVAVAALVAPMAPVFHASLPAGVIRLWGDGVHDDTKTLQALLDQCAHARQPLRLRPGAVYRISGAIRLST